MKAEEHFGKRVQLQADHPDAGKHGRFVDVIKTPFGRRPVVELEEGREVTVMKPEQWQPQTSTNT